MKCDGENENTWRIDVTPSKTEVEMVQVTNHSAQHHQVPPQAWPDRVVAKQIKWPPSIDKKAWRGFDEDVCNIIQATFSGNIDRRLNTLSKLIVGYTSERFGHFEKIEKVFTWNRLEEKIKRLKLELRSL